VQGEFRNLTLRRQIALIIISGSLGVYFPSIIERSNLHLGESQRVPTSFPVIPFYSVIVRRRIRASLVDAVQVRVVTAVEPPATFVPHCT